MVEEDPRDGPSCPRDCPYRKRALGLGYCDAPVACDHEPSFFGRRKLTPMEDLKDLLFPRAAGDDDPSADCWGDDRDLKEWSGRISASGG